MMRFEGCGLAWKALGELRKVSRVADGFTLVGEAQIPRIMRPEIGIEEQGAPSLFDPLPHDEIVTGTQQVHWHKRQWGLTLVLLAAALIWAQTRCDLQQCCAEVEADPIGSNAGGTPQSPSESARVRAARAQKQERARAREEARLIDEAIADSHRRRAGEVPYHRAHVVHVVLVWTTLQC